MDLLNSKDLLEYEQIVIRLNDEIYGKHRVTYMSRNLKEFIKFAKNHSNIDPTYQVFSMAKEKEIWIHKHQEVVVKEGINYGARALNSLILSHTRARKY